MASSSFSYTAVPNSLRRFLKGVPTRGVPSKVSAQHLKSIGLKADNDKTIIRVLKFVDMLDGSGSPTEAYKGFRDKSKGPRILATEIRRAYKELFETYPDAQAQTDENLRNFFSGRTELGQKAISFIVGTFKVLCEFADFSDVVTPPAAAVPPKEPSLRSTSVQPSGLAIHINLQIHLPDATDPAAYDAIFAAINRHLGKLL